MSPFSSYTGNANLVTYEYHPYFAFFECSVNDWRLNNPDKNYQSRFKEDNKDVRIKIRGKLKRYIKKTINPDEAYQNFILEKEEVKSLMFKLRAERIANACKEPQCE